MEKIIINIGRQLGSGGRVIAQKLAETFHCEFYDKEILNLAAKESGFSAKFFEQHDEHKGFLKSLWHMRVPHISDVNFYKSKFSQESLFQFQSDAIKKAASKGSCVFVGRCADYILRDMPEVINIFITADLTWRIRQVMKRHDCTEEKARKIIHNAESRRASYYNYYTGKQWGDAANYDICIKANILGLDATAQYLADFIRERQHLKRAFTESIR